MFSLQSLDDNARICTDGEGGGNACLRVEVLFGDGHFFRENVAGEPQHLGGNRTTHMHAACQCAVRGDSNALIYMVMIQ